MNEEIMQLIENMSEEEAQAILNTEFPPELEKQAEQAVAEAELVDALYAYGALLADREVAMAEIEEGEDLSKEASEQFAAADEEIGQALEAALEASGTLETESEADLHMRAQVAAGVMADGYVDKLEELSQTKTAAVKKSLKKMVSAIKGAAKKMTSAAKKHGKKHGGKAALFAGGMAAEYGRRKLMDKKASEISADELLSMIEEEREVREVIEQGFDKLAAKGKAGMMKTMKGLIAKGKKTALKSYAAAKKGVVSAAKSTPGKVGAGAAIGAAAGYMAAKKMKDK